jgi:hypothetical protein
MITFTISVTPKHIASGIHRDCRYCPIAQAVKEQVPGICRVDVTETQVTYEVWGDDGIHSRRADLPPIAKGFVQDFDANLPVRPIVFELPMEVA